MTTIRPALLDLLNASVPLEEAVDRHFAPDYRQRTNGAWVDREGFVQHVAHLRRVVASLDVVVHEELVSGARYADRHVVDIVTSDGGRTTQEVYLFGDLDARGRFQRVEEVTLVLSGREGDRGIASAR